MVDPAAALVIGMAAFAYAAGVRRLGRRRHPWSAGRSWAFGAGLVAATVATQGPIAADDTVRFSAHMAQHVLLGMVVPLLLVLGAPITLALQTSGSGTRSALRRLLHSRAAGVLSHPAIGWIVFGATPFALYFTGLFELSLRNDAVHALVHTHFLVAGMLFMWPLVGLDPVVRWRLGHGARLGAVLLAVPFHAFLGMALLSTRETLGDGPWTIGDQRTGAGLLWGSGELFGVAAAGVILWQWMAADQRAAARADRQLDRV